MTSGRMVTSQGQVIKDERRWKKDDEREAERMMTSDQQKGDGRRMITTGRTMDEQQQRQSWVASATGSDTIHDGNQPRRKWAASEKWQQATSDTDSVSHGQQNQ